MIVEQLKTHIAKTLARKQGGSPYRISSVGGCPRRMYFDAIGLTPSNPLKYEQLLVFKRGTMAEDILAPLVTGMLGDAVSHGGLCKVCDKAGRKNRYGIHVTLKTPGGITLMGHEDAEIETDEGLIVVDYKSITPSGFDYRLKTGAGDSNASQGNLYCHAKAQERGDVRGSLFIYFDLAGGRLHGEFVEYSPERAEDDLRIFDLVKEHEQAFRWAVLELDEYKGDKWNELVLEHAPAPINQKRDGFPCQYTKSGKIFPCMHFDSCGTGIFIAEELSDEVADLEGVYADAAGSLRLSREKERYWKTERKKFSNILANTLGRMGVKRARAPGVYGEKAGLVKLRTRSNSGLKKSKVPADILAMIPDEAKWKTTYSFVDLEPTE